MAHARMPRGNATAWVSKPRHRPPPIRPRGYSFPRSDHGTKILRPGNLSRARHTSPPGKGGDAGLRKGRHQWPPPPAFRLHRSLPRADIRQGPKTSPAKSNILIWQGTPRPDRVIIKNQKNTLFRSDTTDPKRLTLKDHHPAKITKMCQTFFRADQDV
jgi:hypothetical protein